MLGGAVVTDTARRVLLGQFETSGRYRIDLEALVAAGGAATLQQVVTPGPRGPAVAVALEVLSAPPLSSGAVPSRDEIEWLVRRAAMAPSGGNVQPWHFVWRKDRHLDCYLARDRSGSFLDYECSSSYFALGAAAENALLAAGDLHRSASIDVFPESSAPDLVFRLSLGEPSALAPASALAAYIDARATNRRLAERRPLDPGHVQTLIDVASEHAAELRLVTDTGTLSEVGGLLGAVDRFRFLCEHLHTSMLSEVRFSAEEAASTRDGIDISTLELDEVGLAGLRLLADTKTAAFLRHLGRGAGLEKPARRAVAAASAVAVLSVGGVDARAYFRAGRAMQRVWLCATRLGLAIQPMSVAPYLLARLIRGAGEGFTDTEIARLSALRERYERVFPAAPGRADALLFRLAHAPAPSARALRRSVGAVLTVS
jgi:nitroreductase